MTKSIDIILPVYREEENLEKVLSGIKKYVKSDYKILAIWQDPNDPSIHILKKLKKNNKSLEIVESEKGVGLLNAIITGLKLSKANIVIIMMSDHSDDPRDVDRMVKKIDEGYDLVCASRYSSNGKRIGGSRMKALLSRFICLSLYYIAGISTKDATNAFKCFKKDILKSIKIESKNGFEFPLELTVKSHKLKKKIGEIPTVWKERGKGYSKFKILDLSPYYLKWYRYALRTRLGI